MRQMNSRSGVEGVLDALVAQAIAGSRQIVRVAVVAIVAAAARSGRCSLP